MKIRVADRVVAAVSALLLIAVAAVVVANGFLEQNILGFFVASPIYKTLAVVIPLMLALGCLSIAVRRRNNKESVSQRTDNGELSISVKAIEGLVKKCVDTHEEIQVSSLSLDNERGGLVIRLRIATGASVSIPLVVAALQKQLKQYITACTGLGVKEVCVQVDTAGADVKQSVYDLPDMLGEQSAQRVSEESVEEAEKKLPHQRMFETDEASDAVPETRALPEIEPEEERAGSAEEEAEIALPASEEAEETASVDEEECESAAEEEESGEASDRSEQGDAEIADEEAVVEVTIDAGV